MPVGLLDVHPDEYARPKPAIPGKQRECLHLGHSSLSARDQWKAVIASIGHLNYSLSPGGNGGKQPISKVVGMLCNQHEGPSGYKRLELIQSAS